MRIIMNSNRDNESPWNIARCMETSPNVSPLHLSTVFYLRILLPNNQRMLSATHTVNAVFAKVILVFA